MGLHTTGHDVQNPWFYLHRNYLGRGGDIGLASLIFCDNGTYTIFVDLQFFVLLFLNKNDNITSRRQYALNNQGVFDTIDLNFYKD